MTKTELKNLVKGMKNQIKDIAAEKKRHQQQAKLCTYNIAQLRRRIAELEKEIKNM